MVLLEELAHVHDKIADHRQAGNRPQLDRLLELLQIGDAGEPVPAVDIHRIGTADAFTTRAPECERVVMRLQLDQRVEQHAVVRVERDIVILHARSGILVGIVAVDAEFHVGLVCACLRWKRFD